MEKSQTDLHLSSPDTPMNNIYPRFSTTPTSINFNPYSNSNRTPLSLMSSNINDSLSLPTNNSTVSPYSPYQSNKNHNILSLEDEFMNLSINLPTNHSNYSNHSRTISLPTSFNHGVIPNSTKPQITTNANEQFSSFDINKFSLPVISDNDYLYDTNGYTPLRSPIETNNSQQITNYYTSPSRRNTMFSNASSASSATTNSMVSNHNRDTSRDFTFSTPTPISTAPSLTSSTNTADLSLLSPVEIINFSKDQHGCRMLQKLIDDDIKKNLPIIFNATYKYSTNLMLDSFGNYLIQKIMVSASNSQLSLILIEITPNIESIAINLHGTRALQKLISCLNTPNHHDLISIAIAPTIVNLIHDLNGNHVIQKLISHYNNTELEFLVELIMKNLIPIASHKHGCCVLQKLMNKCSTYQIQRINHKILKNSVYLMKDQFGNYVIQYLISLDIDSVNSSLLYIVSNELVSLSCGKFSSNVVEKCLKLNPSNLANTIHPLVATLINIQVLMALIKDQYGNYVVQTALDIADMPVKLVMAELIKPILPNIKFSNYGKRIYNKVVMILTDSEISNQQQQQQQQQYNHQPQYNDQSQYAQQMNLLPGINFCNN